MNISIEDRQLLVEAAFCALNQGMIQQAGTIMQAFPFIISDPGVLCRCECLMLIGLKRYDDARALLINFPPDEARQFSALITDI